VRHHSTQQASKPRRASVALRAGSCVMIHHCEILREAHVRVRLSAGRGSSWAEERQCASQTKRSSSQRRTGSRFTPHPAHGGSSGCKVPWQPARTAWQAILQRISHTSAGSMCKTHLACPWCAAVDTSQTLSALAACVRGVARAGGEAAVFLVEEQGHRSVLSVPLCSQCADLSRSPAERSCLAAVWLKSTRGLKPAQEPKNYYAISTSVRGQPR